MKQNVGLTKKPEELTFDDCQKMLIVDALYQEAKRFYDGDAWQGGAGWVGPTPDGTTEDVSAVLDEIETALVSHPAVNEIPDRHMDAVIGSEPNWTLVVRRPLEEGEEPDESEQKLIDEATFALTNWWDDKEALVALQESTTQMLLGDRGCIRLMVPEGDVVATPTATGEVGDLTVPEGPLDESLSRIWPIPVEADQTVVLRDPITMKKVGVYLCEVQDALTQKTFQFAEISFINDDGTTSIRTVFKEKGAEQAAEKSDETEGMDLAGRLTLYEMRSHRLFTKAVLDNLKLLNMCYTMMGRNVVLGGFLERVVLNGQMPGEWQDKSGNVVSASTQGARFVPDRMKVGASATNWIQGSVTGTDENNNPIVASPDIRWKDPVSPKTFTESADAAYKNMLHGARQLHLLISGDAVASGESRKQARDDYEKSLKRTKSKIDAAGRWLLETALSEAAVFMGEPGRFAGLRVNFDAKVDAGPLAQGDRDAIRSEVQANLRSIDNAMVELRVTDDPDAEKSKILDEQSAGLNPMAAEAQAKGALGVNPKPSNDPTAAAPPGGSPSSNIPAVN